MTDALALSGGHELLDAMRPAVRSDIEMWSYGAESVAWSPIARTPVVLDSLELVVFQMLDGSATLAELTTDVHEVIGIPRVVAQNRILQIVQKLDAAAMLTTSAEQHTDADELDFFPAPPNP